MNKMWWIYTEEYYLAVKKERNADSGYNLHEPKCQLEKMHNMKVVS